jgi:hypothetical protein
MTWNGSMAWRIEFESAAGKQLGQLEQQSAQGILKFLRGRVARSGTHAPSARL